MSDEDDQLSELQVRFLITGRGFSLDECSARIGRDPTETWVQRHEHLEAREDLGDTAWSIASEWTRGDSVDEAVELLLRQVWPYRDSITGYVAERELSVYLECSVKIWSDAPLYSLSVETMRRLVALGAEFYLGLYDYRGDDDDERPKGVRSRLMETLLNEELLRLSADVGDPSAAGLVLVGELQPGETCEAVERRVREVLRSVVSLRLDPEWTGDELTARQCIPGWFIEACRPTMTQVELARWLSRWREEDPATRQEMQREKGWTFGEWLHWFAPGADERQWAFAWSRCASENRLEVGLLTACDPVAVGALAWLMLVAGAASVSEQ